MRRLIFLSIFTASSCFGAVAFNNVSTTDRQAGGSYSGSHTINSGSNLVAIAAITWDGVTGQDVTAITYGGNTMTSAGTASTAGTAGGAGLHLYYLVAPPTGANTLAVTVSGTPTEIYATMISFTGVDQATPIRSGSYFAAVSSQAAGTTFTHAINSNANDLTMTVMSDDTGISGTNQTQKWNNTTGVMEQYDDIATTAAASVSHTWTFLSSNAQFVFVGLSVQAAAASGSTVCPGPFCGIISMGNGGTLSSQGSAGSLSTR